MTSPPERHLSADSFTRYLRRAVPIEHPLPGSPRLTLFFDPHQPSVGLRGLAAPTDSTAGNDLENLTVRAVHRERQRMIEISVTDARVFNDAYPLLCAVADRVQLDGQSMTAALSETLRRLGHLLRPTAPPPDGLETGLIGELRVLAGLTRTVGPALALDAWRGGEPEEHDFGLPEHDVEVKTTTSETRAHWITSLTQLVPTGQRPLWLVSVQITHAGRGDGATLGDVVTRVRGLFTTSADAYNFDERLHAAGWRENYTAVCTQRWRTRTAPTAYAVTDRFPRLTPAALIHTGISAAEITDVRYRIDLSHRPSDTCPSSLLEILAAGHRELP